MKLSVRIGIYTAIGILVLVIGLWWVNRPQTSEIAGMWQSPDMVLKLNGDGTGTINWVVDPTRPYFGFFHSRGIKLRKQATYDGEHKTMRLDDFSGSYELTSGGKKLVFRFGAGNESVVVLDRM